jgi:hypothetical protein
MMDKFATQNGHPSIITQPPEDPTILMEYMEGRGDDVKETTRYDMYKAIRALYKAHGHTVPTILEQYGTALGRAANKEWRRKAWPITKDQLTEAFRKEDPMLQLGAWLAWKCHARWDEVSRLSPASFTRMDEKEICIAWATADPEDVGLKTATKNRYEIRYFTVVRDRDEATLAQLTEFLRGRFGQMKPSTKVFPWTTAQVSRVVAKIPLPPEWAALHKERPKDFPATYTAHSIKAGAMAQTVTHIKEGLLPRSALAMIAKHANPMEEIPSVSVEYTHRNPDLAHLTGTQDITILM